MSCGFSPGIFQGKKSAGVATRREKGIIGEKGFVGLVFHTVWLKNSLMGFKETEKTQNIKGGGGSREKSVQQTRMVRTAVNRVQKKQKRGGKGPVQEQNRSFTTTRLLKCY